MATDNKANSELTSWKEIADYFGVNIRTVQKWERERGLPVTRTQGSKGRISADPVKLDYWRKHFFQKQKWYNDLKLLRIYALATTALLLIGVGVFLGIALNIKKAGPPARYRLDSQTLIVTDADDREIWRKTFPDPFLSMHYYNPTGLMNPAIWFGDLDGDQGIETVFKYYPTSREKIGTQLFCFSENGEEKWQFVPGKRVSDQISSHTPLYIIGNFLVADLEKRGTFQALVTSHHLSDHPNQFALLASNGKVIGEYWHSGFLERLDTSDLDGDGIDEILLAGVNNGYRAATLVVLDARNVTGASTQQGDDKLQLQGFGPAKEKAVVFFPRSCINRKYEDYNKVKILAFASDAIKINVVENERDIDCEVIYTLNRHLQVMAVEWSDRLKSFHRELESKGELDHPLSDEEIKQMKQIHVIGNIADWR